jgi:hypothetical protein
MFTATFKSVIIEYESMVRVDATPEKSSSGMSLGTSPEPIRLSRGVTKLDGSDAGPVPIAFVALTTKVYSVPLVSPVTTIGLEEPVFVILPGLEITEYPVIGLPPFHAGGVKLIEACPPPGTALTLVGAKGAVVKHEKAGEKLPLSSCGSTEP